MMHWQTDNLICKTCCHRQILWCSTWQTAISAKRAYKWIEISAAKNVLLFHLKIQLITGLAIFSCIYEDGEITIIDIEADVDYDYL